MTVAANEGPTELRELRSALSAHVRWVAALSTLSTLLVLVPTGYMLQVYGRVVTSRSLSTLIMLTVVALALYALMEVLRWARNGIMVSAGLLLETRLRERIFDAAFDANLQQRGGAQQALYDLRTLRNTLLSPAVLAFFDAPVSLLFLLIVFWINPLLGWISVGAALLQLIVTYRSERQTSAPLADANREAMHAMDFMGGILRNSPVISAMGMLHGIRTRWAVHQHAYLARQADASDVAGRSSAVSKMLQTTLSSALLGTGAWLSLQNQLAGGSEMMIAAWILGPRAITPLLEVVGSLKVVLEARDAHARLDRLLRVVPAQTSGMALPPPKGQVRVESLYVTAPGTQSTLLADISFAVPAGRVLAVVGPSGSGKSVLARTMTGIWPTRSGSMRLDGVDVYTWNKAELGAHVGYLPQDVELFEGTLAENIARFGEIDQARVEAAARLAGVHPLITRLPDGYDTLAGNNGCFLSGGQRQLIGLARAVYGDPNYLVLDEPNSNLDEAGDAALLKALHSVKQRGATVIVVTHRPSILAVVDLMLVLRDGRLQRFGERDEVLDGLGAGRPRPAATAAAAGLATH